MTQRVKEDGESERSPVMGGIEVEGKTDITSRESGQTSIWSLVTKAFEKPVKETKQMTVVHPTGAVSHDNVEDWHSIDWQSAHKTVRRLQTRIVKATQEGRWGKVKALQHLLTRSNSAKALAVKRVTENQGKNTPGVDGELWDTPQKKLQAVYQLRQHGYRPLPLKRTYIPKSSDKTKKRPLGIPTLYDRAMQALYLLALEPVAETTADTCSYGFRRERSAHDAIERCFTALAPKRCAKWVMEGDIKACFDTISHEWLLTNVPVERSILRKWLKAGYLEKGKLFPTEEGTPQGGIISPVLANMALDGLEALLLKRFPKHQPKGQNALVNLVRYADDFIITGCSRELLEHEVKPLVEAFLQERGLRLSPEKTLITHIDDGFDFLGQNVRKYKGKLLIKPARKSIHKLLNRVRELVKTHPQMPAGKLIFLLNPIIKGWAMYHRHAVSGEIFGSLQHDIVMTLWRWVKRRHRNKGALWRKRKYFKVVNGQDWTFFGDFNGEQILLFDPTHLSIQRHIQVQSDANPFDPAWEMYFERRLELKMVNTLKGKRHLIRLWKEQCGICPICQQKITTETGWHNHHILERVFGGSDRDENCVLLHPNCHALVHTQKLTVEKPRPSRGV